MQIILLLGACKMDRRALLHLGLLLLAVPIQYLVTRIAVSTEAQRSYAIRNLLSSALGFKNNYLSWKSWKKWCTNILQTFKYTNSPEHSFDGAEDENGESPAIEVIKYNDPKGYFGESTDPRTPRPPEVKYRVGQVIKHKLWGYKGVIIGWDTYAKAPEFWLKHNHPADKSQWRKMPNYAILVDTRDRLSPQVTYVPEENIEIISNTRILHPSLDTYFEGFDGAQYLPRPWLKSIYPHDS